MEVKKSKSPITLFIQMKNKKKCRYNGNRFTEDLNQMILNLYRLAKKKRRSAYTMIIYDNRKPKGENIVVKWQNGLVVYDISSEYGIEKIQLLAIDIP